jgi:hypothetical protein
MKPFLFLSLTALAFASPLHAADQNVCGKDLICAADPQTVVTALQQGGYRAELISHPKGPYIASSAEGYRFHVLFNDCNNGVACRSLQLSVLFTASDIHTAAYANGFNARYRFLQVGALPNKQLRLSYDLSTEGGITRTNFSAVLASWADSLRLFTGYAREQAEATPPAPTSPNTPKG